MADPSVTYSFSNGEVASAPNVNQNFNDIIGAIRSASTADLGCGTLKVASVPFASAVVSAMQSASVNQLIVVNTFTAGTVAATSATIGGVGIASYIESLLSMATGTFTATVTGCTGTNTFEARYEKIKSQVFLRFPEFTAPSDGGSDFTITGLPVDIHPSPISNTVKLLVNPMGFLPAHTLTNAASPYIAQSNVSEICIYNESGFWESSGSKGWTGDRVFIYSV